MNTLTLSTAALDDAQENADYLIAETTSELDAISRTMHMLDRHKSEQQATRIIARAQREQIDEERTLLVSHPHVAEHKAEASAIMATYGTRGFRNGDSKPLLSKEMAAWCKRNAVEVRLWTPSVLSVHEDFYCVVRLYAASAATLSEFQQQFASDITQRWG